MMDSATGGWGYLPSCLCDPRLAGSSKWDKKKTHTQHKIAACSCIMGKKQKTRHVSLTEEIDIYCESEECHILETWGHLEEEMLEEVPPFLATATNARWKHADERICLQHVAVPASPLPTDNRSLSHSSDRCETEAVQRP